MRSRATPQTLDPLGALAARNFVVLTVIINAVIVTLSLIVSRDNLTAPLAQGLALVSAAGAFSVFIIASSPRQFPFRFWQHLLFHLLMMVAVVLDCTSRSLESQNASWSPIAFSASLLVIGSFRPWRELVGLTLLSTAVVGLATWWGSAGAAPIEQLGLLGRNITPMLGLGFAGAVFAETLVTRLTAWQSATTGERERERENVRLFAQSSVLEDQRDLVSYRAEPFLRQVLLAGHLTPSDVARARGLVTTMRGAMVREASETWLTELVDELSDDIRLADTMNPEQRWAVGALLSELRSNPHLVRGSLRARISGSLPGATAVIDAQFSGEPGAFRLPGSYAAVLRSCFINARIDRGVDSIRATIVLGQRQQRLP